MTVVFVICAVFLTIGACFAVVRIERGPSVLDRALSLDIITSSLIIGVALEAAWSRRFVTVPVLAALALVGFVASVSVARFASVEPEDVGRIKTAEEVEIEETARREAEDEAARIESEAAALKDEESGP